MVLPPLAKTRLALQALSLSVALSLGGCTDEADPAGRQDSKPSDSEFKPEIRLAINEDLPTLDPHLHLSKIGYAVLGNIFEPLICRDPENGSLGCVAENWQHEDFQKWSFQLRPGTRFHDGRSLTLDDVLFSIDRGQNHPDSEIGTFLLNVESVSGDPDTQTLNIVLKGPDSFFLDSLTYISIVPEGSPERITEPIGSGPYRLHAYLPGESIQLSVFEDHWAGIGSKSPGEFLIVPEAEKALELLESGQVDLVNNLPPRSVEKVESNPQLWVESRLSQAVVYLTLNPGVEPFNDARLRRAVDLGIDRDALMREVTLNHSRPASQMATPSIFGHNPDLKPTQRDLPRAQALLQDTGLALPIPLRIETTDGFIEHGETLKAQLNEVGFSVELVTRPWPELYEDLSGGRVGSWLGFWFFDSPDAAVFFYATEHSRVKGSSLGSSSVVTLQDSKIDSRIATAAEEKDLARREALLQKISQQVTERNVQVPLVWPLDLYGTKRSFEWRARMDNGLFLSEMTRRGSDP